MKKLTYEEVIMLGDCQSEEDWGNACRKIKGARNGNYPEDWWDRVKLSGLMDRVMSRWGQTSDLKVSSFDNKNNLIKYINERNNPKSSE